jgi:hypothetical protein
MNDAVISDVAAGGLFAAVQVHESRKTVAEPEPGFLAAEAARARAAQ